MNDAVARCVAEVMRLILDPEPAGRERGADEATDVLGGVGALGRDALAMAICVALAMGGPTTTIEAQLNALAEIETYGALSEDVFAFLRSIDVSRFDAAAERQLQEILERT